MDSRYTLSVSPPSLDFIPGFIIDFHTQNLTNYEIEPCAMPYVASVRKPAEQLADAVPP